MSHTPYASLAAESKRCRMPQHFKTDLTTHDRAALRAMDPAEPFGWVLWEAGTYLIRLDSTDRTGRKCYQYPAMVGDTMGSLCRFYFWDGVTLISCANAADLGERLGVAYSEGPDRLARGVQCPVA